MNQMPTNLLALFARRKEIGYALMENGVLYRYGVTRIRAKGDGHDFVEAVVQSLCRLLEFVGSEGLVVIEQIDLKRRAPKPKADIPLLVKRYIEGVYAVTEMPLSEVKQHWCNDPNVTHHALALAIARQYPVFERQIKGAKRYKTKYWEKAIISVALAEIALNQLKSGEKRKAN